MKSAIQKFKENMRSVFNQNRWDAKLFCNGNDYIGYTLREKNEDGENYFTHIDECSTEEELREFLKIQVKNIKSIHYWIGGEEIIIS